MASPPSAVGCIQSNIWIKYFDFLLCKLLIFFVIVLKRNDPKYTVVKPTRFIVIRKPTSFYSESLTTGTLPIIPLS